MHREILWSCLGLYGGSKINYLFQGQYIILDFGNLGGIQRVRPEQPDRAHPDVYNSRYKLFICTYRWLNSIASCFECPAHLSREHALISPLYSSLSHSSSNRLHHSSLLFRNWISGGRLMVLKKRAANVCLLPFKLTIGAVLELLRGVAQESTELSCLCIYMCCVCECMGSMLLCCYDSDGRWLSLNLHTLA